MTLKAERVPGEPEMSYSDHGSVRCTFVIDTKLPPKQLAPSEIMANQRSADQRVQALLVDTKQEMDMRQERASAELLACMFSSIAAILLFVLALCYRGNGYRWIVALSILGIGTLVIEAFLSFWNSYVGIGEETSSLRMFLESWTMMANAAKTRGD